MAAVKSVDGADLMHIWYQAERVIHLRLGDTKGEWYRFKVENVIANASGEMSLYLTIHGGYPKKGSVLFDDVIVVEQDKMPVR